MKNEEKLYSFPIAYWKAMKNRQFKTAQQIEQEFKEFSKQQNKKEIEKLKKIAKFEKISQLITDIDTLRNKIYCLSEESVLDDEIDFLENTKKERKALLIDSESKMFGKLSSINKKIENNLMNLNSSKRELNNFSQELEDLYNKFFNLKNLLEESI